MNRVELEKYIRENYGVEADYPWAKSPSSGVFRHSSNRKWFALVMEVPKDRLGLQADGVLPVVNLKCEPVMIGTLRGEKGFFPAYHMSRDNWITVALDGSASDEKIKMLLEMSFEATSLKPRKRGR